MDAWSDDFGLGVGLALEPAQEALEEMGLEPGKETGHGQEQEQEQEREREQQEQEQLQ